MMRSCTINGVPLDYSRHRFDGAAPPVRREAMDAAEAEIHRRIPPLVQRAVQAKAARAAERRFSLDQRDTAA